MRNSTVVKAIYNGNGITRRWDIPFEYLDTSEIAVILTTVVDDINVEEHIPTSDYTIDISSNEVIYPSDLSVSPIEEGKKVTIHRVTDLLQKSDYTNQGALWPESVEASFDKIHQILHEQKESIDRSVKVDITGNDDPQQYFNEIIETAKLGLQKATEAIAAAEAAEASETAAAASATAAAASASSMDESVATCTEKAAEAAASAASIDEAAQTATAKAAEAVSSATAAAGSATAAAGSAATAQSSASAAAGSASAAATSETNATTAATSATTAKTAAETAASNAATSATAAAGSATAAANSVASIGDSVDVAQQAAQDAQDAADSIGDAEETCTTAAQNAATSATAAANSATSAEGSATTAAEKAAEVIHIVGGKFGYRQEETRYNAGDMAFFTWTMNTMYIECTTGGVTASGDLVINNPSVGDVVQDGTVVWTVRQFAGASVATDTREGITKIYGTTGNNTDGTMTQAAITEAINTHTPSTATDTTAGVTKVYTTTGSNTDGTMSQAAITEAINTHTPGTATDTTAGITKVYTTTGSNTDGTMTQAAIMSAINSHTPSTATDNTAGIAKLYTTTGNNTDGAMTQAAVTNEINNRIASVYKPAGNKTANELVASLLNAANSGKVYNVTTEFTTTSDFVEGAGKTYPADTNVVVIEYAEGVYKFDVLAGMIPVMTGSTSSTAGTSGIVPTPPSGAQNKFLRGDGTWAAASSGGGGGIPLGAVIPFAGTTPPEGFLLCNGAAVSRTMYPDLFDLIGTTYGNGDGSTTFNLPDYRFTEDSKIPVYGSGKALAFSDGSILFAPRTSSTSAMAYTTSAYGSDIGTALTNGTGLTSGKVAGVATKALLGNNLDNSGLVAELTDSANTKYIIKAFDGQTHDSALIDITQYAQALADLSLLVPPGTIISSASNDTQYGYLLCDGSAVSRTTYSALFAAIGTTWGDGDGSTTFNLPNLNNEWLKGSSTAGSNVEAGLPNITGAITSTDSTYSLGCNTAASSSGALYTDNFSKKSHGSQSSTATYQTNIKFDASKSNSIYGSSPSVSVSSKTVRFMIKY